MRFQLIQFTIVFLFFSSARSQEAPKNGYHSPLGIPLLMSANFGEIRPNHFHMGVDFKTNGAEGYKLYAIEEGYISRVKVSPYGYGRVVYIDHPNGVTSVYAHCSAFVGKLDSLVKVTQEKKQNFEVEIYPKANELKVSRGEYFALSGNTGSSTAPHLHFELRDTKTETALNPLVFGFDCKDQIAPEIRNIKVYSLSEEGYRLPGKSKKTAVIKNKAGNYTVNGGIITVQSDFCSEKGGIGLAFEVGDHYSEAPNPIGVYGSFLIVDKDTLFQQRMDSVSFDCTRYINSHIDYEESKQSHQKFQKSFRTKDNPLGIYPSPDLGVISSSPTDTLAVSYIVFDTKNNSSRLDFKVIVQGGNLCKNIALSDKDYLMPDTPFEHRSSSVVVHCPASCVYEPTAKNLNTVNGCKIGNSAVPVQTPIHIEFPLTDTLLPTEKYFITANSGYVPTKYNDGWLQADAKTFGNFAIGFDTIPPTIAPFNFNSSETVVKHPKLMWKIADGKSGIIEYDIFIDGKWELLEFETKGSFTTFFVPTNLKGEHTVKVVVRDACNNIANWERVMIF